MEESFELDPLSIEKSEIYEGAVKAFHDICFNMNEVRTYFFKQNIII